ncbi:uncharacterized protein TOT_020000479 [Theileria orientalis strain Shintoku]|uniref:Thioredoxin domain-containing protein n=1 Tax=Theileria orientalis strain Shintoku TaxID=869250 RepID=J4C859_THEOR|nr:uncharacterized protein TOT_020000479 [Theileria orientalis strain Shintoku]PVC51648.1 hypothetical protein MACL_00001468 [Theileria orientalis]BAM40218.1 uncharacterized protein TOT_020000479 [Theileria orientalis strain Shintoku]|eukprot:XP_009690519.1 uncharacterized protein TOT_020000479 [Theileria orientalis strain Shintoku]
MLFLSKFRTNWLKLPSLSVLNTNRPIFLYLFSNRGHESPLFLNVFSESKNFANSVKNLGIDCYLSDVSNVPCSVIDKLEVTTVPVVLGLLNGKKLGEVLSNGSHDSLLKLCDKLRSFSNQSESEYSSNMRELVKDGNLKNLRANLSFVKTNMARETESDPALFKSVSEATIICQDDKRVNLRDLLRDLEKLDTILNTLEIRRLSGEYTQETSKDYLKELDGLANKYLPNTSDPNREDGMICTNGDSVKFLNIGELRTCHLMRVRILKLISVKHFLDKNVNESLKYALEAYKANVRNLQRDFVTPHEFSGCGSRDLLGSLFTLFDPNDESLLSARSEVENVMGPRLLGSFPVSTKPKGGVTRKRRGFGGRYIWQGMEYRPKKYKPKNIKRFLNEWRCVQDSNTPSFN